MESAGDRDTRNASVNPVPKEYFKVIADHMRLNLDDAHMELLQQIAQDNELLLAAVDASSRVPSEDPFDFMRFVRTWRELHGK